MGEKMKDITFKDCNRFSFESIRCFNNGQDFVLTGNYKITKSAYMPVGTYASLKQDGTNVRIEDFCLEVSSNIDGKNTSCYEMDIVSYSVQEHQELRLGAVCYDKEKYMWIVKDLDTKKEFPLYTCRISNVLGNLFSNSKLLDETQESGDNIIRDNLESVSEDFSAAAEVTMAHEEEPDYAMLHEPVPGLEHLQEEEFQKTSQPEKEYPSIIHVYFAVSENSDGAKGWTYYLSYKEKSKSDRGFFNCYNEEAQYYFFASAVISLSKITDPKRIVVHSPIKALNNMFNSDSILSIDSKTWKYKNGSSPSKKTQAALSDLQRIVKALGVHISAEYADVSTIEKLAANQAA